MAVVEAYQPPKYLPQLEDGWYHVLYGHVPGYQLDFIYRPHLPFQKLKLQHFGDLQLVIRHLRPPLHCPLAFAICNLSAHDTQHRPGHGALAIAAAVRLNQASDHAGRVSPVFSHAAVLVDQPVTADSLAEATHQFVGRFGQLGPKWYREYYDENRPFDTLAQSEYLQHFSDLPSVANHPVRLRWRVRGMALRHARLLIHCPERQPLSPLLEAASRIAAILYHSRVRWLSVGNGEPAASGQLQIADSAPELTVRFVQRSEPDAQDSAAQTKSILLAELPPDEQDLAALLGLDPVAPLPPMVSSRSAAPAPSENVPVAAAPTDLPASVRQPALPASNNPVAPASPQAAAQTIAERAGRPGGRRLVAAVALGGAALALFGVLLARTYSAWEPPPKAAEHAADVPPAALDGRAKPKQPGTQAGSRTPAPKPLTKTEAKALPPKAAAKGAAKVPPPITGPKAEAKVPGSQADAEQVLKQANERISRCPSACRKKEGCQDQIKIVRTNIVDYARKPQLVIAEVKRLCDYCPSALPTTYCKPPSP